MGWGTASEPAVPAVCATEATIADLQRFTAENASLRDQLARERALRVAAEQRAEAMAW